MTESILFNLFVLGISGCLFVGNIAIILWDINGLKKVHKRIREGEDVDELDACPLVPAYLLLPTIALFCTVAAYRLCLEFFVR